MSVRRFEVFPIGIRFTTGIGKKDFDCSRTKFDAIIANVSLFYAKFVLGRFLLQHSFDFNSQVTFSRLSFDFFVGLNWVHSEIKFVARIKLIVSEDYVAHVAGLMFRTIMFPSVVRILCS